MDENIKNELSKAGIEGIRSAQKWIETTGNFVKEQAPIVVQEIIRMGYITNIIYLVVGIVSLPVAYMLYRKYKWSEVSPNNSDHPGFLCVKVMGFGVFVLSFYYIVSSIYELLVIHFCPRLYVLQQLSQLVK